MIIIGAGAAGMETLGVLMSINYKADILFFDEDKSKPDYIRDSYRVIKNESLLKTHLQYNPCFVVAIGNPRIREKMMNRIINLGGIPTNIVGNKNINLSEISENGSIIQPGVVISTNVIIGRACMIHANTVIGHSVKIGDFVSISPLVSVVGPCTIGNHTFIGAGSIILPKIIIGQHVVIGAGSKVDRNIEDFETFL